MGKYRLTVAGLGPGAPGLVTRETWDRIATARHIILRTRIHPTVEALDAAGISYESYDDFYETAADFEELYARIAGDLLHRAAQEEILYLVPGSPFVAERTVHLLRAGTHAEGEDVKILPAMSFLEPLFAVLGLDPVHGLSIVDAADEDRIAEGLRGDTIVTQVYAREIASNLKLLLMEHMEDTREVYYLHHLCLPDERIARIALFELDRQEDTDHLTSLFIPDTPLFWEK